MGGTPARRPSVRPVDGMPRLAEQFVMLHEQRGSAEDVLRECGSCSAPRAPLRCAHCGAVPAALMGCCTGRALCAFC
jgi:hypothetical protein